MTAQVQSMPSFSSDFGAVRDQFTQLSTGRDSVMDQHEPGLSSPTDESRGRRRNREGIAEDSDQNGGQDGAEGVGNSKKRRRSRKGLDKKFECPHEGCGKSYSRAEHLYRHQLNRTLCAIVHFDPAAGARHFLSDVAEVSMLAARALTRLRGRTHLHQSFVFIKDHVWRCHDQ
jgi:hypothetical protein